MFRRKRILYLGSISILLLSGLLFVAHTKLIPTAHAASCVATSNWGSNCTVDDKVNSFTNLVYAVQEAIDKSSTPCGASEDGNFGPNTKAAVICFQKAKGINQSGQVGSATWKALQNTLSFDEVKSGIDWSYYYGQVSTVDVFRMWNKTEVWYVQVTIDGTWCPMNGDSPCDYTPPK